jgi:hypothetical protein
MLARKPPKRLFKSSEVVSVYEISRSRKNRRSYMTREHIDVLQNIEAALVSAAREVPGVDDRMIDQVLRACIKDNELPTDGSSPLALLAGRLAAVRGLREDISDEVWTSGLLAIHDSVKLHSALKPGERSYLEFVSPYV